MGGIGCPDKRNEHCKKGNKSYLFPNFSIKLSVHKVVHLLAISFTCLPVSLSICPSIRRSVGRLVGRSVGRVVFYRVLQ